jgi:hypothetical protein
MRDSRVIAEPAITLIFARIGGNLDVSISELPSLDLAGTQVRGEFALGSEQHPAVRWRKGAKLTLRNTEVGAVQDRLDAWPDKLDLEGFSYHRLGGFAAGSKDDMAARNIAWFKAWLAKHNSYSPQPYEQLAGVLLKAGHKEKANAILYESKERDRREGSGRAWREWLWLWVLKLSIGYGYGSVFWHIFVWTFGFTAFGEVVLRVTGQDAAKGLATWPERIFFSLDMFLPVIHLREAHYKIDIEGWARYWFFFHKFMGFFFASLLVAALSGLTPK